MGVRDIYHEREEMLNNAVAAKNRLWQMYQNREEEIKRLRALAAVAFFVGWVSAYVVLRLI